jgi:hypothetical protein
VTQGLDNETFLGDDLGGCTRVNDLGGTADGTRAGTELLDVLDNIVSAGDLAEDNVLAVEPASLHGGDEELGAVAIYSISDIPFVDREGEAYVLGPALAMDRRPTFSWRILKFSSANFSP